MAEGMTDIPRCPVCGDQAIEVAEQVLVTVLDEEGKTIPLAPRTSRRWFECPQGHGGPIVRDEEVTG